ncbi:MAG TPA: FAD-dependent oxidoreductase [Solirubrobacteraceae bacterium]|nr:FAD-dependent oxidoreductase [Solirubrobacteraceae bacterium]
MSRRYDLVVVGGGTAGLVSAMIAAGIGARVALIERERTGGDCLWTGCVPSKTLLAAASLAQAMRRADRVGLTPVTPEIDFAALMKHVRDTIAAIEPQDSPARLRERGVEVIEAGGRFLGPGRIAAGERTLDWLSAIIATGSRPRLPDVPGLARVSPLTSDTVWDLGELPARLTVLGGGAIGCELAQAFARLGARVTLVEVAERLLPAEEPEAGTRLAAQLREEGISVRCGTRALAVAPTGDGPAGELKLDDGAGRVGFDRILVATGREPRTDGLGLDTVGVQRDARGAVVVDERLRTTGRRIFAAGDVTGLLPFTHVAAHHARVATPNALFHTRTRVSGTIPRVTFTDPEVARVGLSEAQARERWGTTAQVARFDYTHLDRAITEGRTSGFVKLIGDRRGRLVGATIAAPGAGEAIAELTAWIRQGAAIDAISQTVHAYPTLAEGPARAADERLSARFSTPGVRRVARVGLGLLRVLTR